jgi:hypothetical protein
MTTHTLGKVGLPLEAPRRTAKILELIVHRLLLIDFEGLMRSGEAKPKGKTWIPWLIEVLRPWDDVRIVLHSMSNHARAAPERQLLGELAPRVIGNTYNLPQLDALEAALRINDGRVKHHLLVVVDSTGLPSGRFNVLMCDKELGLSAPEAQEALTTWLSTTAPRLVSLIPKPSKGSGEHVLYLDFDGVLHHEDVRWALGRGAYMNAPGHRLFEHVGLLEGLIEPYPQLKIVLSTSWARVYSCYGATKRLPSALRERVIGATWHSEMSEHAFTNKLRGKQVVEDVMRRRPLDWLALDDTDEGWPTEVADHMLITDENLGISAPGMSERIAVALARMHAPKAT